MKKLILTIGVTLFLTALPAFSQSSEPTKTAPTQKQKGADEQSQQVLYSRWNKLKKENPAEARKIATEYFLTFPNDKSKNAQVLRRWLDENNAPTSPANEEKTTTTPPDPVSTDAKPLPAIAAGIWTIVVTTQQGDLHFTLTLKQEGKDITGAVKSPYGDGTVSSGTIEGNLISLDLEADPLEVKLKGTVLENKMKGTVTSNIPNLAALPFVGTRSK